ncbi:MAG: hypothetical protein KF795_00330 [Labilithrix sp.]|nr:hypothetical protein [Labilithrix sp.]
MAENDISWLDRFFVARTIADDGVPVPQRPTLNFAGAGVDVVDDEANNRTNVTIIGGGGGGGSSTPSGSGFRHVTAGVEDAAARDVMLGTNDVSGTLPATKGGTGLGVADLALASGEALVVNGSGTGIETASIVDVVDGVGVAGDVLTRSGVGAAWRLPLSALGDVGGRLTLQSGTPVPTSNVSGSSLFFTPYRHGGLALWNEPRQQWQWAVTEEVLLVLSGLSSGFNHDVFAYLDAGVVALEIGAPWASNTARSEPLSRRDGVLVKSADHRRRYLGTLRATSSSGTTDSELQRFLWNFYNQVPRDCYVQDATSSWTWNSASFRQARGQTFNRVEVVVGLVTPAHGEVHITQSGLPAGTGVAMWPGIGIDSTTVNSARSHAQLQSVVATQWNVAYAVYDGLLSVGYHAINWLEAAHSSACTAYGLVGQNQAHMRFRLLG